MSEEQITNLDSQSLAAAYQDIVNKYKRRETGSGLISSPKIEVTTNHENEPSVIIQTFPNQGLEEIVKRQSIVVDTVTPNIVATSVSPSIPLMMRDNLWEQEEAKNTPQLSEVEKEIVMLKGVVMELRANYEKAVFEIIRLKAEAEKKLEENEEYMKLKTGLASGLKRIEELEQLLITEKLNKMVAMSENNIKNSGKNDVIIINETQPIQVNSGDDLRRKLSDVESELKSKKDLLDSKILQNNILEKELQLIKAELENQKELNNRSQDRSFTSPRKSIRDRKEVNGVDPELMKKLNQLEKIYEEEKSRAAELAVLLEAERQHNKDLNNKLESLNNAKREDPQRISNLENQIRNYNDEKSKLVNENSKLFNDRATLEKQIIDLKDQIRNLTNPKFDKSKEIKSHSPPKNNIYYPSNNNIVSTPQPTNNNIYYPSNNNIVPTPQPTNNNVVHNQVIHKIVPTPQPVNNNIYYPSNNNIVPTPQPTNNNAKITYHLKDDYKPNVDYKPQGNWSATPDIKVNNNVYYPNKDDYKQKVQYNPIPANYNNNNAQIKYVDPVVPAKPAAVVVNPITPSNPSVKYYSNENNVVPNSYVNNSQVKYVTNNTPTTNDPKALSRSTYYTTNEVKGNNFVNYKTTEQVNVWNGVPYKPTETKNTVVSYAENNLYKPATNSHTNYYSNGTSATKVEIKDSGKLYTNGTTNVVSNVNFYDQKPTVTNNVIISEPKKTIVSNSGNVYLGNAEDISKRISQETDDIVSRVLKENNISLKNGSQVNYVSTAPNLVGSSDRKLDSSVLKNKSVLQPLNSSFKDDDLNRSVRNSVLNRSMSSYVEGKSKLL